MQFPNLPVTSHQGSTLNFERLQKQLPQLVTTLPLSPFNGQEMYYLADATNGVVWHLRYRAGSISAYKWEFVGGTPFIAGPSGEVAIVEKEEKPYVGGPELTIPRGGEYRLNAGAQPVLEEALLQEAQVIVRKNGVIFVTPLIETMTDNFSGVRTTGIETVVILAEGDKLSLAGKNIQKVKTKYTAGTLYLTPVRVT